MNGEFTQRSASMRGKTHMWNRSERVRRIAAESSSQDRTAQVWRVSGLPTSEPRITVLVSAGPGRLRDDAIGGHWKDAGLFPTHPVCSQFPNVSVPRLPTKTQNLTPCCLTSVEVETEMAATAPATSSRCASMHPDLHCGAKPA